MPPRISKTPSVEGNALDTYVKGGFLSIPNLIGAAIGNFINSLLSLLPFGIGNGLQGLADTLNSTNNTATGAVQQIVQVRQQVIAFDIKSPVAGWISINPTEYPSFPRALLMMQFTVSGGGNNNAQISRQADPETGYEQATVFNATTLFYAYVRIPVDNELTALNFYAAGTPSALHVRVYPMAANGDLLDAITPESPNLGAAVVNARHTSIAWTFPEPVIVEAGSWVAIGFRCVGTCRLAAQDFFDPIPPDGFFPIKLSSLTNRASGVALPESIPQNELAWTTGTVPYVAIGNNILEIPNKRNLSDNFDRPDTSAIIGVAPLGPGWSARRTGPGITAMSGMKIRDNAAVWSGDDDGRSENTQTTPLTTEHVLSYVHIGDPKPTAYSHFFIASNATGTSGIKVAWRRDEISLWKKTGMTYPSGDSLTAPVARTLAYGDSIELQLGEWVDNVFFPDVVLVRHNGAEIIRVNVPDTLVPRGAGKRYVGCGVHRAPFQSSTPILDWQAFDIPDVEMPEVP